ncbi:putative Adenine nucleotide alpha hydrolases-like superfamily protein [Tripterygium wilfordii]|uniref:Putative Adenine nucleotide alpha hydrolases-like superfamily protein n=1 Tax=Tripterygium wilfordii TaxID=458696 RepID=A0A7J7D9A8_TRIWF|nr:U-box domain-containing protein 35 [Tripterygium wilfordii]KAF5742829.1 putative Adenine nucleotide alpha hydrolases-like superfamily protein [Tripterygium wilfordii]
MSVTLTEYYNYNYNPNNDGGGGVSEIIEEENLSSDLFEINHVPAAAICTKEEREIEGSSLFSFDVGNDKGSDCVYVCVGKSESSMDALSWTLNHALPTHSTIVYLIHVFPEIHFIPSPLGKLPKGQVSPDQVESYMAQERGKRRQFLQKYLDRCSASKVNADTMLIESDDVAKAILDLISILNIRRLVIGTNKSSLRKLRSKRGTGIADQILQNTAQACEINVICEGKEVSDQIIGSSTPSPRGREDHLKSLQPQDQSTDSFSCNCFKPRKVL